MKESSHHKQTSQPTWLRWYPWNFQRHFSVERLCLRILVMCVQCDTAMANALIRNLRCCYVPPSNRSKHIVWHHRRATSGGANHRDGVMRWCVEKDWWTMNFCQIETDLITDSLQRCELWIASKQPAAAFVPKGTSYYTILATVLHRSQPNTHSVYFVQSMLWRYVFLPQSLHSLQENQSTNQKKQQSCLISCIINTLSCASSLLQIDPATFIQAEDFCFGFHWCLMCIGKLV